MPTLKPKSIGSNMRTYSKREPNEPSDSHMDMKLNDYSERNSISNDGFENDNMSDDLLSGELQGLNKFSPRISKYTNLDKSQISNFFPN